LIPLPPKIDTALNSSKEKRVGRWKNQGRFDFLLNPGSNAEPEQS
jgi:hypothetical protein